MYRFLPAFLFLAFPFMAASQTRSDCSGSVDTLMAIYVVDFPDVQPQFQGGDAALQQFIKDNLGEVDTAGTGGKAAVEFIVDIDGTIKGVTCPGKNFKTVSHLDWSLMKVALKMPPWIPGQCNGRMVAVRVRIPLDLNA